MNCTVLDADPIDRRCKNADGCCPFVKCSNTYMNTVLFHRPLWTVNIQFALKKALLILTCALESSTVLTVKFVVHCKRDCTFLSLICSCLAVHLAFPPLYSKTLLIRFKQSVSFNYLYRLHVIMQFSKHEHQTLFGLTTKLLCRHKWFKNGEGRESGLCAEWREYVTQCLLTDSGSFFIPYCVCK